MIRQRYRADLASLFLGGVLLTSALLPCATGQSASGARAALLVGNSSYRSLPHLASALEETRALEMALTDAGFRVTRKSDLTFPECLQALAGFLNALRANDTAFFYFAGYTAQVAGDDNYLLPIEFDANGEAEMETRALRLRAVQQRLNKGDGLKILMLEAPHALNLTIRRATGAGVEQPSLAESRETLLAFAATPGEVVQEPDSGKLGLFTEQVIQNIAKPGIRLRNVFQDAKDRVAALTQYRQVPLVVDDTTLSFYFHDADPDPVAGPKRDVRLPPGFPSSSSTDHEDYRWIPPGTFQMGCVPADQRCLPNEQPRHEVTISKGFWMGRNEVQVISYKRYLQTQPGPGGKKRSMPPAPADYSKWNILTYPMVNVSWQDAKAYCGWAHGRLPTEAEWEYAARTGLDAIYPFDKINSGDSRDKANFEGKQGADIFERVAPVHSFDANAWGLNDMAGNVWEWVSDIYSDTYYQDNPPRTDPRGPSAGRDHVMRGGSFDSEAGKHLRVSVRKPGATGNAVGFRCILEDSPSTNKILGR